MRSSSFKLLFSNRFIYSVCLFLFTFITLQNLHAQTAEIKIGQKVPGFKLKILNKNQFVSLDSISKSKIVVIEFWATWCGPCIHAFPHIDSLRQKFAGKNVDFISVTYETNEKKLNNFFVLHPLGTLICIDQDMKMFKAYQAWAIPQTLIIDKNENLAVSIYPTRLTEKIIQDVLDGKTIDIPENVRKPYNDPQGAEDHFRKIEKEEKE